MVRIIGIGDAKMDKNITDMIAYPGGQAMNIAVNAKLQGAQAGFIGCIGDDVLGQHLAKTLDELGVDRSRSHIVHADNAATNMVGHKLGEFVATRTYRGHGKDEKKSGVR